LKICLTAQSRVSRDSGLRSQGLSEGSTKNGLLRGRGTFPMESMASKCMSPAPSAAECVTSSRFLAFRRKRVQEELVSDVDVHTARDLFRVYPRTELGAQCVLTHLVLHRLSLRVKLTSMLTAARLLAPASCPPSTLLVDPLAAV
jgi:hypothetical protein